MTQYRFKQAVFDVTDGSLQGPSGTHTTLRPKVAELLVQLLTHPQQVISKSELIEMIWPDGTVIEFETGLAAVLKELRHQLAQVGLSGDLVETLPRRGVRFNAVVQVLLAPETPMSELPMTEGTDADFSDRGSQQRKHSRWHLATYVTTAALLMLVAFILLLIIPNQTSDRGEEIWPASGVTLVILPFEVFGAESDHTQREGLLLADALLSDLWSAQLDNLQLLGRASLRAYQDPEGWVEALASDLGADLIIEGRVVIQAKGIEVNARLFASHSMQIIWSETVQVDQDQGSRVLQIQTASDALVQSLTTIWGSLSAQFN
jgi:DNA-binding winged helix-turn-helix (wHTH) protein/TolB-like protein